MHIYTYKKNKANEYTFKDKKKQKTICCCDSFSFFFPFYFAGLTTNEKKFHFCYYRLKTFSLTAHNNNTQLQSNYAKVKRVDDYVMIIAPLPEFYCCCCLILIKQEESKSHTVNLTAHEI